MNKDSVKEQKDMLWGGFKVLTEHVKEIINEHRVLPAEISIPYHSNGKWIRLRLTISPTRTENEKDEELA